MANVQLDIEYTAQRDRLSSALRVIYAIPHLIIVGVLGDVAGVLAVVQWFIILFTGKRNLGLWNLSRNILGWQVRVSAYVGLMYDVYPNFGFEKNLEPVTFGLEFEESANRLTCALRMIWAIPAVIVLMLVGIAGFAVTIVCWFAIVATGTQSRGMFDFLLKVHRYGARTSAYTYLLTDTYPKYE